MIFLTNDSSPYGIEDEQQPDGGVSNERIKREERPQPVPEHKDPQEEDPDSIEVPKSEPVGPDVDNPA